METAMSEEDLKELKKTVSTRKRIAMECASQVHDLVEDRLLSDYGTLVDLAQQTVNACEAWAEARDQYESVKPAEA